MMTAFACEKCESQTRREFALDRRTITRHFERYRLDFQNYRVWKLPGRQKWQRSTNALVKSREDVLERLLEIHIAPRLHLRTERPSS